MQTLRQRWEDILSKELVVQLERQFIEETLEKNQENHTRVAEQLGLSRQGLLKKMHRYGIG